MIMINYRIIKKKKQVLCKAEVYEIKVAFNLFWYEIHEN